MNDKIDRKQFTQVVRWDPLFFHFHSFARNLMKLHATAQSVEWNMQQLIGIPFARWYITAVMAVNKLIS